MSDDVIIRNRAVCLRCGDEIESQSRHNMVWCSCGAFAVDGGREYLRRVGDNWCDTSVHAPDEPRDHRLECSPTVIHSVHHSLQCAGRTCPIHRRTDHALRSWQQEFNPAKGMRRLCTHGLEHHDPDDTTGWKCRNCDKCCVEARMRAESERQATGWEDAG